MSSKSQDMHFIFSEYSIGHLSHLRTIRSALCTSYRGLDLAGEKKDTCILCGTACESQRQNIFTTATFFVFCLVTHLIFMSFRSRISVREKIRLLTCPCTLIMQATAIWRFPQHCTSTYGNGIIQLLHHTI